MEQQSINIDHKGTEKGSFSDLINSEKEVLVTEIERLTTSNIYLQAKITSQSQQLQTLSSEVQSKLSIINKFSSIISDLNSKLEEEKPVTIEPIGSEEYVSNFHKFQDSYCLLLEKLDSFMFQIDETISVLSVTSDIESAVSTLNSLKSTIDVETLLKNYQDLSRQEIITLVTDIKSRQLENETLKAQMKKLKIKRSAVYSKLNDLVKTYQNNNEDLIKELKNCQDEARKANESVQEYVSQVTIYQGKFSQYLAKHKESTTEITSLVNKLDQNKEINLKLENENILLKEKIKEKDLTLKKYNQTIKHLQEEYENKDLQIAKLRKDVSSQQVVRKTPVPGNENKEIERLQNVIEDQEQQIEVLKGIIRGVQGQVKQKNFEIKRMQMNSRRISKPTDNLHTFDESVSQSNNYPKLPSITKSMGKGSFLAS